jgi:hypothetical protein
LAKVVGKHTDRFGIRSLFQCNPNFGLHGTGQEAFVGVGDGQPHLFGIGAVAFTKRSSRMVMAASGSGAMERPRKSSFLHAAWPISDGKVLMQRIPTSRNNPCIFAPSSSFPFTTLLEMTAFSKKSSLTVPWPADLH